MPKLCPRPVFPTRPRPPAQGAPGTRRRDAGKGGARRTQHQPLLPRELDQSRVDEHVVDLLRPRAQQQEVVRHPAVVEGVDKLLLDRDPRRLAAGRAGELRRDVLVRQDVLLDAPPERLDDSSVRDPSSENFHCTHKTTTVLYVAGQRPIYTTTWFPQHSQSSPGDTRARRAQHKGIIDSVDD